MEFIKKHWLKALIAVVLIWIVWKYVKGSRAVAMVPGMANPGDKSAAGAATAA